MECHLKGELPNIWSLLEKKSVKMYQRKVIYKIMSYMETINAAWSVTVHCCSTMTSNPTSSWQTKKGPDSHMKWRCDMDLNVARHCKNPKVYPASHWQRRNVRERLYTKIVLLPQAALELKIAGTGDKTLVKFCYICPVLKLICKLLFIVRERF